MPQGGPPPEQTRNESQPVADKKGLPAAGEKNNNPLPRAISREVVEVIHKIEQEIETSREKRWAPGIAEGQMKLRIVRGEVSKKQIDTFAHTLVARAAMDNCKWTDNIDELVQLFRHSPGKYNAVNQMHQELYSWSFTEYLTQDLTSSQLEQFAEAVYEPRSWAEKLPD